MAIVLQLPSVKRIKSTRPRQCPHCQGETFQRWGKVRKQIKDRKIKSIWLYRYRCTSCRRTFRDYPEGLGRALQSERMKLLAVICWSFGLSYRKLEAIEDLNPKFMTGTDIYPSPRTMRAWGCSPKCWHTKWKGLVADWL